MGASELDIQRGRGMMSSYELVAQNVSDLNDTVAGLNRQLAAVERTGARLEVTALDTAHALSKIARRWDAVVEAMRRQEVDLRSQ